MQRLLRSRARSQLSYGPPPAPETETEPETMRRRRMIQWTALFVLVASLAYLIWRLGFTVRGD